MGKVWLDANRDGIRQPGEEPIRDVTVELIKDGIVIATTTTNSTGDYVFDNLPPGSYAVQLTKPDGTVISPKGEGLDRTIDSDFTQAAIAPAQGHLQSPSVLFLLASAMHLFPGRICDQSDPLSEYPPVVTASI